MVYGFSFSTRHLLSLSTYLSREFTSQVASLTPWPLALPVLTGWLGLKSGLHTPGKAHRHQPEAPPHQVARGGRKTQSSTLLLQLGGYHPPPSSAIFRSKCSCGAGLHRPLHMSPQPCTASNRRAKMSTPRLLGTSLSVLFPPH